MTEILDECYQEFINKPYYDRSNRERVVYEKMKKLEDYYLNLIETMQQDMVQRLRR